MPDKYTYPGTETLINRLGIKDQVLLDLTEQNLANIGLSELSRTPLRGSFDFSHLQTIHRKLVGDLYEWAGELRTTDTQAIGTGVAHCRPEFIEAFAKEVFGGIAADDFLRDLLAPAINRIHPRHHA
jgi:cell filamentation protein